MGESSMQSLNGTVHPRCQAAKQHPVPNRPPYIACTEAGIDEAGRLGAKRSVNLLIETELRVAAGRMVSQV